MKILEQIENETKKINSNIYNFSFSSDEMDYKSMLIGFNKNLYSLFNSHYMNLNISKSIKDLFMGEIVNETENQSALHHVYRDLYAEKSNNFLSEELLKTCSINIEKCIELKEILINKGIKNVVTIGIGGSFEGPKLLIETLTNKHERIFNHIFFII